MYRYISYLWMSVAVLFVQIFILDNISLAAWMRPMIFPVIVLLLPTEWRLIWVILSTFAVGFIMDLALGGSGLYVASLLPLAAMRSWLLFVTTHRSAETGEQKQLLARLNVRQLMVYMATALLIHHALFFGLEALSFASPVRLLMSTLFSALLSLLLSWFVVRIFTTKVIMR